MNDANGCDLDFVAMIHLPRGPTFSAFAELKRTGVWCHSLAGGLFVADEFCHRKPHLLAGGDISAF